MWSFSLILIYICYFNKALIEFLVELLRLWKFHSDLIVERIFCNAYICDFLQILALFKYSSYRDLLVITYFAPTCKRSWLVREHCLWRSHKWLLRWRRSILASNTNSNQTSKRLRSSPCLFFIEATRLSFSLIKIGLFDPSSWGLNDKLRLQGGVEADDVVFRRAEVVNLTAEDTIGLGWRTISR